MMINMIYYGDNDNGGVKLWFQVAANKRLKNNFKVNNYQPELVLSNGKLQVW